MIQTLPNEILFEIFRNLDYNDLMRLSLVSKSLNDIATHSSLWKDFDLSGRTLEEQIKLLQLPRFQRLNSLTLTNTRCPCWNSEDIKDLGQRENEILKLLMGIELEELKFKRFNFEAVNRELLANVVSKVKVVRLNAHGDLEQDKLSEILQQIPGGKIRDFQLEHVDFSGIGAQKVEKAVNSLEIFCSDLCHFEESQIIETFGKMSRETKLRKLFFRTDSLKEVPPTVLSKALNKLQVLFLVPAHGGNVLSSGQLVEFFNEMSKPTNLQKVVLTIPEAELGSVQSVSAGILTKATNKLQAFMAPGLRFSESQIKAILTNIAKGTSLIRHLNLGPMNELNFSEVDLDNLRSVIKKIKSDTILSRRFKRSLQGQINFARLEEIMKLEEENDKEEGENKLSEEEITEQWKRIVREIKVLNLETINKRNRHERLAYKNGPLRYLIDKLANM